MRSTNDKWDIPFQPTSKKRQAAVYLLEAGKPVSRDEVAQHADLPKSTITEVVHDLTKAGYTVSRETDAYRRAWFQVMPHDEQIPERARTFPKRPQAAKAKEEGAVLTLEPAAVQHPVQFKGISDGQVEVTWDGAPGVLFSGELGESVPVALLAGTSRVERVSVHPSGLVTLDLGFAQVRGALR